VKDAGKTADLSITVGDAQNQATEMSRLLQQAVSSKYDAIILFGGDPNSLSGPLKAAKAADIPVILAFNGDPSVPTAQQMSDWNTVANGTYCYSCAAALVADYAIVSTGAKVNAMMTWDPTALSSTDLKKGFQNELAKWCPKTCSASYVNTPGATAFADTGSATQAAVQKQTVNFIFPQYDGYIEAVLPAIKSGQAENRIAVGSDNADLAQMQEMAAGGPVKVDIGSPVAWSGWAIVDQVLRALTGMAASPDEHLPLRVFDAANVKDFDLSADPGTWYGPVDYRASYEKLWGLS
jgi:ribose transport system substrate-binding protein